MPSTLVQSLLAGGWESWENIGSTIGEVKKKQIDSDADDADYADDADDARSSWPLELLANSAGGGTAENPSSNHIWRKYFQCDHIDANDGNDDDDGDDARHSWQ